MIRLLLTGCALITALNIGGHVANIEGTASTYGWGEKLNEKTASGDKFNPHGKTAAMYGPKFGTTAKVTDTKTGRSVNVTINDRGPNKRLGRVIDLSQGAWRDLGYKKPGLTKVKVELK